MAYDGKILAKARTELENIRRRNADEQSARLERVYARVPEIESIDRKLDKGTRRVTLHIPYSKSGLLDMLYREAKVESVTYSETTDVVAVCTPRVLGLVEEFIEK